MSLFRRVLRPTAASEVVRECKRLSDSSKYKKHSNRNLSKELEELCGATMVRVEQSSFTHREVVQVLEAHAEMRVRASGFIAWITTPLKAPNRYGQLRVHECTRILQALGSLQLSFHDLQQAMLSQIDYLLKSDKFDASDAGLCIVTLSRELKFTSKNDLMMRIVIWLSRSAIKSLSRFPKMALSLLEIFWSVRFDPDKAIPEARQSRIVIALLTICEQSLDTFDLLRRYRLLVLVTNKQLRPPMLQKKLLKRSVLGIVEEMTPNMTIDKLSKLVFVVQRDLRHSKLIYNGDKQHNEPGLEKYLTGRHAIPVSVKVSLKKK
eukprot:TRINITY_DN18277_c0_g1_i1.p2 TRINITY_DN18277_c0_g1~~TRINITY_DN18277_c0_g1_i1.p2  ORF type:complete len:321 (+),score=64.00 TRINITY_DN18277_c0_g1_i1:108-1070(+)